MLTIVVEPLAHGDLEGFGEIVTVMIVNALHGGDRVSDEFGVLDVEDLALGGSGAHVAGLFKNCLQPRVPVGADGGFVDGIAGGAPEDFA